MFLDFAFPGMKIRHYSAQPECSLPVLLIVAVLALTAMCPLCQHPASRVHSRYERTLADTPVAARRVLLKVEIRRFFCDQKQCQRRIFAERLPQLANRYARATKRLLQAQTAIAQAVGSRAGTFLATVLHMPGSATTLLRRERAAPIAQVKAPRALGVDDFAFKKGNRYGTILVDLESHHPIDLLEDREAATLTKWLKEHPGSEIISRDRAGAYALGAREGAPEALQVADRFHLLHNGVEVLERFLTRYHRHLNEATLQASQESLETVPPIIVPSTPVELTRVQCQSLAKHQKRRARYEQIGQLHAQGVSIHAIAETLAMSRRTVRRFVRAQSFEDAFPEQPTSRPRPNKLDEFEVYLRERWDQGCHNASQLFREIQKRGFVGTSSALRQYLAKWRIQPPAELGRLRGSLPNRRVKPTVPSTRETTWLLLGYKRTQDAQKQKFNDGFVDCLCAACPLIMTARTLVIEFFALVRESRADVLESWLCSADASGIMELQGFSSGLRRDLDAVVAGISLSWSNGVVEGNVNRLKFIKRRGYGRANFDLLRRRVLQMR